LLLVVLDIYKVSLSNFGGSRLVNFKVKFTLRFHQVGVRNMCFLLNRASRIKIEDGRSS